MGLFNALLGNVSEMDANALKNEYQPYCARGRK